MRLRNIRLFGILLCFGAVLHAHDFPAEEPSGCASFRADSDLVIVPVNAFDAQNRIVNHLDPEYFRVFEDGVEQPVVAVGEEDTPVSVGIVFDTSASIGPKIDLARQAVAEFLKTANPADEFFFLPFDSRPGELIGFTSRQRDILDQVAQAKTGGTTAMLDAIQTAFLNIRKAHNAGAPSSSFPMEATITAA